MEEIEDAVMAGPCAGGDVRPGDRTHDGIAGLERTQGSVIGQSGEVGQFVLLHQFGDDPRVQPVHAQHNAPLESRSRSGRVCHGVSPAGRIHQQTQSCGGAGLEKTSSRQVSVASFYCHGMNPPCGRLPQDPQDHGSHEGQRAGDDGHGRGSLGPGRVPKIDAIRCRTRTIDATASPPVAPRKARSGPNRLKTCCEVLGSIYARANGSRHMGFLRRIRVQINYSAVRPSRCSADARGCPSLVGLIRCRRNPW